MTLEKLIQLSLQYLEVDAELNTTEITIKDLKENDTFLEYLNNAENAIYSGIARYASSLILPLQEIQLNGKLTTLEFTRITIKNDETHSTRYINVKERIFQRIKEVYALDEDYKVIHNIKYNLIGSKLIITEYNSNYMYFVVYYPNVMYFENYRDESQEIYDIDLAYLKVTDEVLGDVYVTIPDTMAINLKYMLYSELKMEDTPNVANINKNYFESYLNECSNDAQTQNYQEEVIGIDYGDIYGYKDNDDTGGDD